MRKSKDNFAKNQTKNKLINFLSRIRIKIKRIHIIILLMNVFFTFLFWFSRGLFYQFSSKPILHMDYAPLMYLSIFTKDTLFPYYHSVFGYSYSFLMGMPIFIIYPPGLFVLVAFLSNLGLTIYASYKIVSILIIFFMGLNIFITLRKLKISYFGAFIANLWFWVGLNAIWQNLADFGMLGFLFSANISIYFMVIANGFIEENYNLKIYEENMSNTDGSSFYEIAEKDGIKNNKGYNNKKDTGYNYKNDEEYGNGLEGGFKSQKERGKDDNKSDKFEHTNKDYNDIDYYRYYKLKEQYKQLRLIVIMSILILFQALLDFMVILYSAAFIVFNLIIRLINRYKSTDYITKETKYYYFKRKIIVFIIVAIASIILASFWLFPVIFIQFGYTSFNTRNTVFSFSSSIQDTQYYLILNSPGIIINVLLNVLVFIYIYRVKGKNQRFGQSKLGKIINATFLNSKKLNVYKFFLMLLLLSIFFTLLAPLLKIYILWGINSLRYFVFFEISLAFLLGFTGDLFLAILKYLKLNRRINQNIGSARTLRTHKIYAYATLSIIILSYFGVMPFINWKFTYRYSLTRADYSNWNTFIGRNTATAVYSYYNNSQFNTYISGDHNYTDWSDEDLDMISWIINNTDKTSRILFQISGDKSGLLVGGGHTLMYLSYITDRYYATGIIPHFWFKYTINSTFSEDMLFGKPLINYTKDDLKTIFDVYNIGYIIVWSSLAKSYFNNFTKDSFLSLQYYNTKYNMYSYNGAPHSYIYIGSNEKYYPIYPNETEFGPKGIIFNFNYSNLSFENKNTSEINGNNNTIIISLHDYPNWFIYINGQLCRKENSDQYGFIRFKIPPGNYSNLSIKIVWKQLPVETFSTVLSIGGFIILIGALVKKRKEVIEYEREYNLT